ncbi:MAG TPA: glycoside hydrolase family 18 protein [Rhodanobacteraceae bacterium]|nr:glycoside hydrolase family 18 protein [Rhodanobacteraceae bacterium]
MRRSTRHLFQHGVAVLLIAFPLFFCMPAMAGKGHPYRIVAYTTGWNASENAQLGKIDTLIFAFATISDGRVVLDDDAGRKLDRIIALKPAHPDVKVVISVGGWGAGGFSEAAGTAAGRREFADSATRLVVAHHADGLDVDWEYPGHHESGIRSSPQDRANFTLLLEAVRASLDRAGARGTRTGHDRYTLSAAVADGPFVSGVDIAAIAPLLDWFNLMTYDFVNSMMPTTGHHTALHLSGLGPDDTRTADRAVRQFLAAGVPSRKLLIGVAMYGREFDEVRAAHEGLYQPYGRYGGEHPWPDLKRDFIDRNGYARYWDAVAEAPWLWNPRTRTFISYDDPESIAAKAAYVRAQHLGGIMYWEQQQDPGGELLDAIWRGLHAPQPQAQRN